MTDTDIELGILGPLLLVVDGAELRIGTPKQRAVMAMLVINRNRPVSIDALMTAAWEQSPPQGARASIHSYVSNLRRLFGDAGSSGRSVLVNAPPGYQLCVPDTQIDLGRFIAEKTAGVHAAAAGQFEKASKHLVAALAEWRGEGLDDLHDFQFATTFATTLAEDKITAHTALAESEIACGRASAVLGELEALAASHPYREPLWAQLITAYYLAGRQSDALSAYRKLRLCLADALGVDPYPAVQELHGRILRQEPLNVKQAARTTAIHTAQSLSKGTKSRKLSAGAQLRDSGGHCYPLLGSATRIGRLPDNDIVFDDPGVSRHHAVIIDTGTSFVINDLRSANGVIVRNKRIYPSASLDDGDRILIGRHELRFELRD
jgi:DNA-binding SARP family transcriptional activator